MIKTKRAKATLAVTLAILLALTVGTVAFFVDRATHQMQFTTATFTDDGYTLTREAPNGPYAAGETITVPITETNTGAEDIKSSVKMTATWSSPDTATARQLFNGDVTLKIGDTVLTYEVSQDKKSITFTLPEQVLGTTAGTKTVTRDLLLTVPDSFVSTGTVTFTFIEVDLAQSPVGFTAEYDNIDLNTLKCSTQVVWAASTMSNSISTPNGNKALYGYLNETCDGIIFEMGFNYNRSAMKDFANTSASKWSNYKSVIKTLSFPDGMTTVGDYAFDGFTKVTSVSFPSTTGGIGQYAFNGSGLTGTLTIPATVNTIEERAFGLLPSVTTITFNHTNSDVLTLPDNKAAGKTTLGAFYVASHVDTVVNSDVVAIQYKYGWHDGWDNRRPVPTLTQDDRWQYTTYWGDTGDYSYETPIDLDLLTTIEIADYYIPTGNETIWDVSDLSVPGTVTAYLSADKTKVTIAGNGYGSIFANECSNYTFSFYNNYYSFTELTRINGAELLDVSNVVEARDMFTSNSNLEYVNVSNWDTGNIKYTSTGYKGMFSYCYNLSELDVSNWDTSSMVETTRMFDSCSSLTTLDVSKWDTSACENTMDTFAYCSGLTEIDVNTKKVNAGTPEEYTAWDVSNVENAAGMFQGTANLKTVNMKDWNTAKIWSVRQMFESSGIESIDLSGWNESTVTNVESMFQFCENLTDINLDGWDLSHVTDSDYMLRFCTALESVTFPTALVNYGAFFADNCSSLTTIEFLHAADTDITFDDARGGYGGAFPLSDPYSKVNPLRTKITTVNTDALNYGWTNDFRGYVVTVDTITGSNVTVNPAVSINGKTITINPAVKTGYTYQGATVKWTDGSAQSQTLAKDALTFQMPAGDVTVTPDLDLITYTIGYNLNGGTVTTNPTQYTIESPAITLNNPTKQGYTFLGWTGSNGNTPQTTVTIAAGSTGNKTYTANWRADLQRIDVTTQPTKTTYTEGETFDKAGMVVTAYYTDGTSKPVANYSTSPTGELSLSDTTITVTYTENGITQTDTVDITVETANITITYNGNGGTFANNSTTNAVVHEIGSSVVDSEAYQEPTLYAAEFLSWYTDPACTAGSEFDVSKATTDTTVYAKWKYLPVLAENSTWYKGSVKRNTITSASIVKSYSLTGNETESWAADVHGSGAVMCYRTATELIIAAGNGFEKIYANKDSTYVFGGSSLTYALSEITTISGLDILDTSSASNMSYMFSYCSGLTSLDLSSFNTANVSNMSSMFYYCSGLTSLDLSSFNTAKVSNMSKMFNGCGRLTSLNLSSFNTAKVSNMSGMFSSCSVLTSLDLSNFNTAKVSDMSYMFSYCRGLTSLDLSSFDTSNVSNMSYMFYYSSGLKTVFVSSLWNTQNVARSGNMFYKCTGLVGGNSTTYNSSNIDATYACVDKAGQPGYFTYKAAPATVSVMSLYSSGNSLNSVIVE